MVPGSFVNIRSVTAEIFLIWTDVARTNVAWTNVTATVGIYSRCSQEPRFKVSAEILMKLSLCGGGGGGVKSFSCQTQLLS